MEVKHTIKPTCKYEGCSELTLETSKEGFCIFHEKDSNKDQQEFRKLLKLKTRNKDYNYKGYFFVGKTSFREYLFHGDADFREAQFTGDADFEWAQFTGEANFEWAQFLGKAYFLKVKFSKCANFLKVKLSGDDPPPVLWTHRKVSILT